eukprot:4995208-Prymnesium_polylepis.5
MAMQARGAQHTSGSEGEQGAWRWCVDALLVNHVESRQAYASAKGGVGHTWVRDWFDCHALVVPQPVHEEQPLKEGELRDRKVG